MRQQQPAEEKPAAPTAAAPMESQEASWADVAPVDVLGLEVGYRLIPLVDMAYLGLADGLEQDAAGLRLLVFFSFIRHLVGRQRDRSNHRLLGDTRAPAGEFLRAEDATSRPQKPHSRRSESGAILRP